MASPLASSQEAMDVNVFDPEKLEEIKVIIHAIEVSCRVAQIFP